MKVDTVLHTNGCGLWSRKKAAVKITKLEYDYDFGELRVFFDTKTWNTHSDGLIYTDSLFMKELKAFLKNLGFNPDVDYSEQGMQEDNYVSCDVGEQFINSWINFKLTKTIDWNDKQFKKEVMSWILAQYESMPEIAARIYKSLKSKNCPWPELDIIEQKLRADKLLETVNRIKKLAGM